MNAVSVSPSATARCLARRSSASAKFRVVLMQKDVQARQISVKASKASCTRGENRAE